jgi:hypothetical protein
MKKNIFLPIMIAIIIVISACTASKGSILIIETPNGAGFTMDFNEWRSNNKCELSLNRGDVLQIEVVREDGEIALVIIGKNGAEPYTGNGLGSGVFTVTVPVTDKYEIRVTGKDATGKITVKNVEISAK